MVSCVAEAQNSRAETCASNVAQPVEPASVLQIRHVEGDGLAAGSNVSHGNCREFNSGKQAWLPVDAPCCGQSGMIGCAVGHELRLLPKDNDAGGSKPNEK